MQLTETLLINLQEDDDAIDQASLPTLSFDPYVGLAMRRGDQLGVIQVSYDATHA